MIYVLVMVDDSWVENKIKIPYQKPTKERKRNGFHIEIDDKKPENNKMYKI